MVPRDAMTVKEASQYLAMDEQTVARMAADRQIPSLHHDGQWLFSKKSIDKWRIRQGPRRIHD